MTTLFALREEKTRIRQRDWLKLAGEKIRREQVGSVPTFLVARANKVAKWKIGLKYCRWVAGRRLANGSIVNNFKLEEEMFT